MTKKAKKPVKTKVDANQRKIAFAHAFLVNGRNITQAAISAGFKAKTAAQQGSRLLKSVQVQQIIEEANRKAAAIAGLSVERTLKEVARLAYADPRKLYDESGNLIPIHQLDDDTAATVASIEVEEEYSGRGESRALTGHLRKVKQHSKSQALDMAMKHHKLYSEDQQPGTTIINKIYYGSKKQ
jgi:phage terminase small subunit